jgi:dienelactone hydrolase
MRRPLPRAALVPGVALVLAVAVVLAGSSGAAAAPGEPAPGSPEYLARDAQNIADAYGRQTAPDGQLSPEYGLASAQYINPVFAADLLAQAARPNRPALTPAMAVPGWNSGNPYRKDWAGTRGQMTPVSFTNRYGALVQGDVFAPLPGAHDPYTGAALDGPFPGVVITTGSVQGSERMYWWLAQDLAERGYVVLTYDVQGQGRTETFPHQADVEDLPYCDLAAAPLAGEESQCPGVPSQQTSNFVYGTEDAIDFFLSTPSAPYGNPSAGSAAVDGFNPLWELFDRSPDTATTTPGRTTRLALVGHSLGAIAVSYVQGVDDRVQAVVALDKLSTTASIRGGDEFDAQGPLTPVVPGLGVQSEYGFTVAPYFANSGLFDPAGVGSPDQAPDPRRELATGYDGWTAAGVDSMVIVPRASTHLEYTDIAYVLPASRYGQAVASHYTQAWLGKYLQHDPAADDALLATSFDYLEPDSTGTWRSVPLDRADHLSFYFCSGYDIATASGRQTDDDIAGVGCA